MEDPPSITAEVAFPRLLTEEATAMVVAKTVPSEIVVAPVYELLPDSSICPAPAFVIPNKAPLITPLIVKSLAEVPSSATVTVLVAPKATGQEMVAPEAPPALSVTDMFPPSVNTPDPVIDEPVTAPPSRDTLVGDPNVKAPNANVVLLLTVKAPFTVVFMANVFVPLPLIVKLLKVVEAVPFIL